MLFLLLYTTDIMYFAFIVYFAHYVFLETDDLVITLVQLTIEPHVGPGL